MLSKQFLPTEFIQYWKALCAQSATRSVLEARRLLIHRYRNGHHIPGYPVARFVGPLPTGWSLRNLYRLAPTKTEQRLNRS